LPPRITELWGCAESEYAVCGVLAEKTAELCMFGHKLEGRADITLQQDDARAHFFDVRQSLNILFPNK